MVVNVAVDGPSGAGKSTISRASAKELGFIYVDTGALYRAVGVYALRNSIGTKDPENIEKALKDIKVELKFVDGVQHVFLNGEDVSTQIRTPEASMAASDVSAIPCVRAFLFDLQREIAKNNNCLMDGRDIGTVVLPDAKIKIFLTASAQERAKRRHKELVEKGVNVTYEEVLADLQKRDYQDSHREIAPLKPAEDSITVDTSDYNFDEAKNIIVSIIKERI